MQQPLAQDQIGQPQPQMAQQQMQPVQQMQQMQQPQQLQPLQQPQQVQQLQQPQQLQQVQQMQQPQLQQPQQLQQLQQMQQQMMYCPLRLVYDTPMIMQTGDQMQQIQQPQSIYMNQPPWARPQNQVIYVQQIGPNLVPVQSIDPNMYMQQYQQVIPQMMPIQNQVRPMMTNTPTGMIQNYVPNVQGMIEQPVANFGYIQSHPEGNIANVNVVNNDVDRQTAPNQNNVQVNNAQNAEQMQIYRQVIPQMNQQVVLRPQIAMMNQIQGMHGVQMVAQNVPNMVQNNLMNVNRNSPRPVGDSASNIANTAQIVKQNVVSNVNQNLSATHDVTNSPRPNLNPNIPVNNVVQNIAPNQPTTMRQVVPNIQQSFVNNIINVNTPARNVNNINNLNTVTYSAVRNGQPYTYRAIQPKTNIDVRLNIARGSPTQFARRTPEVINNQITSVATTHTAATSPITTFTTEADNRVQNKKRKSESPDEVPKKVSNFGSITVTSQVKEKIKAKYASNTSEIGTNTSPVHRPKLKVESPQPVLQINPMTARENTLRLLAPAANVMNNLIKHKMIEALEKKDVKDVSQQTDGKKLVRKTVYPQAKNRLLDDKVNVIVITAEGSSKVPATSNEMTTQINIQPTKVEPMFISAKSNEITTQIKIQPTKVEPMLVPAKSNDITTPIKIQPTKVEPMFFPAKSNEITTQITKVEAKFVPATSNEISTQTYIKPKKVEPKLLLELLRSGIDEENVPNVVNVQKIAAKPVIITRKKVAALSLPNRGNELLANKNKTDVKELPLLIQEIALSADRNPKINVKEEPLIPNKANKPKQQNIETEEKVPVVVMEKTIFKEKDIKLELSLPPKVIKDTETIANENYNDNTEPKQTDIVESESKPNLEDVVETIVKPIIEFEEEIEDTKLEKKEYKNISINEMKGKEIHMVDGNIHKQERDYILTHVLDGFVIQESNVPFAIRKPLKERTNAVMGRKQEKQDPSQKNFTKEEMKDKIMELSQLHLDEGRDKTETVEEVEEIEKPEEVQEVEEEEVKEEEPSASHIEENEVSVDNAADDDDDDDNDDDDKDTENPFSALQHSDVKAWTVDQLVSRLKIWPETVSVLQEHEIDGESLFLVSRTQLVTIGVSEQHADCICEFVNGTV